MQLLKVSHTQNENMLNLDTTKFCGVSYFQINFEYICKTNIPPHSSCLLYGFISNTKFENFIFSNSAIFYYLHRLNIFQKRAPLILNGVYIFYRLGLAKKKVLFHSFYYNMTYKKSYKDLIVNSINVLEHIFKVRKKIQFTF